MAIHQAYVPLQFKQNNRFGDFNKDGKLINCYIETQGEQLNYTVKRPGFETFLDFSTESVIDDFTARGLYIRGSDVYNVIGNQLFRNDLFVYEFLDGSEGRVEFDEFTQDKALIKTNKALYTLTWDNNDNAQVNEITDQDYPDETVRGLAVLNGKVFVMNKNSEIVNSKVDDEATWEADSFITAEAESDDAVALIKQRDILIAFGTQSTEFFFDAGAPPPGSPLKAQRNSFIAIGCGAPGSIARSENSTIFVAEDQEGHRFIAGISGTQYQPLSTISEDRILSQEGNLFEDGLAWISEADGHKFYVLNLSTQTLVYDIQEKAWYTWSTNNDKLLGKYAEKLGDRTIVQEDKKIYEFKSEFGTDDQQPIQVTIVTPLFGGGANEADFGMKNKMLTRLELIGDLTGEGKVWISWTDDDYKTFTRPRCVDLSRRDFLTRCGRFQRRAFRIQTEFPNQVRFRGLELRMDVGSYGQ